jgi:hypothetical protein
MAGPTDPPEWLNNNKGKAQNAFDRALAEKQQTAASVESEQVKKSAPGMKLTPNGPMRAGPDRQAHNSAMIKDNDRAKEARALQLAESVRKGKDKQAEKAKDKERER